MEAKEVKKRKITRRSKAPITREEIEAKIKELDKKKKLLDLDIQKLQIELEFLEETKKGD